MTNSSEPIATSGESASLSVDPARVREALLALEGTVIEDLRLPLPGDLRDIAKAAALVSGIDMAWEAIEPSGSHRVVHPENAPGTTRNLVQTLARGEIHRTSGWAKDADNYGKLDRLYDPQIRAFRETVWSLTAAGKTFREWHSFARGR